MAKQPIANGAAPTPTPVEDVPVWGESPVTADRVDAPKLANVVEVEYMVYGTFREHFNAATVKRDYAGTHMFVECATGQVVRVTVDPLDDREMEEYKSNR